MIPKRAIKKYLARKRIDFRPYKALTAAQLEARAAALPIKPPIWHKLRRVQKICFLIGVKTRRFGFLMDTGMGKTFLTAALARYFRRAGISERNLVLVPNKANKWEWAREVRKHTPNTSLLVLHGSSAAKWQQLLSGQETLVVETYAGLAHMVCKPVPHKRKKRMKLTPIPSLVAKFADQFGGLYLDESTGVQNRSSLPYRICRQIAKHMDRTVFALSGTPFGKDPTALWSQLHLLDMGETLGETLGLFRAAFFKETENAWGGYEYTFDQSKDNLLNDVLANRTIRFEADDDDMPKLVPMLRYASLPQDAQAYYDKAKSSIIAAHGNYREMKNAFLRMRQISSGFLGYYDDESGEKARFAFDENPKLDLLCDILGTLRDDAKFIVFHDFIFSGGVISDALTKMGIGYERLYSKTKNPERVLHRFDNDPKCRGLVLNNDSGGYGLNLQVARYGIYYESPVSVIMRKQTRRRFERQGSKFKTVFQYDLVVRGTVDEKILEFHRVGGNLFKAIIEGANQRTADLVVSGRRRA